MNGYLRTPKINKFNDLILWLNDRYNYNIPIYSPDTSDLKDNGWLSGFIDADGGFKIRYTEKLINEKKNFRHTIANFGNFASRFGKLISE